MTNLKTSLMWPWCAMIVKYQQSSDTKWAMVIPCDPMWCYYFSQYFVYFISTCVHFLYLLVNNNLFIFEHLTNYFFSDLKIGLRRLASETFECCISVAQNSTFVVKNFQKFQHGSFVAKIVMFWDCATNFEILSFCNMCKRGTWKWNLTHNQFGSTAVQALPKSPKWCNSFFEFCNLAQKTSKHFSTDMENFSVGGGAALLKIKWLHNIENFWNSSFDLFLAGTKSLTGNWLQPDW